MRKPNFGILGLLMFITFVVPCYSASVPLIEENLKEALVKKDWDKVIEMANIWEEQVKTTLVPYFLIVHSYYAKGDYQKILQPLDFIDSQDKIESLLVWVEEFVKEYPQNSVPHLLKGDVYTRLKKYDEAINELNITEELEPTFLVYSAKGMVYAFQNNYDLAIKNFTQAIKVNPNSADVYNNRGIAYYCQGDCELALNDFEQAIKRNSTFTLAYLGRGKAYQCLGKTDLAADDFKKAKEIDREGVFIGFKESRNPSTGAITKQFGLEFTSSVNSPKALNVNPATGYSTAKAASSTIGGIDSEPKGKTKKIRKGEVVSEKTPDDNFITSASYFLLYRGQFLFKEKGE